MWLVSVTTKILTMQAEPFNMGLLHVAYYEVWGEKIVINKNHKSIQNKRSVAGGYLKDSVTPLGQGTTMAVDFLALNLGCPLP